MARRSAKVLPAKVADIFGRAAVLGMVTDYYSAFMNQTVFDYCRDNGLEQTRSRAYKKNDQACVEQKSGASRQAGRNWTRPCRWSIIGLQILRQ